MTENFNQNYENGRFCERDGFCISGCCTADTTCNPPLTEPERKVTGVKVCKGILQGKSCNHHE